MILKKYTSADIGKSLLATDFLITPWPAALFSILKPDYTHFWGFPSAFLIDGFIESLNLSKYFNVVCKEPEPICRFIKNELHRSATIVDAKGAFSGERKYLVLTVLNRFQAVKLRNYIKENAPDAFLLISNTSEIIGKGFHSI